MLAWTLLLGWAAGLCILGRRMYQRDHARVWQGVYEDGHRSAVVCERDARAMVEDVPGILYAEHLPTCERKYHWGYH